MPRYVMPREFERNRQAARAELRHAVELARCALRLAAVMAREPLIRAVMTAVARLLERAQRD